MKVVLLFMIFSLGSVFSKNIASSANRSIASMKHSIRVVQGKELMGRFYRKSDLKSLERKLGTDEYIFKLVKKYLPKKYKVKSKEIAQAIIDESFRNELDPFFVMAIIGGESSFNPQAKGTVGEIGLMQIRLSTGKWMSELSRIKWNGKKSLRDPIVNIKLGTAYLRWLRKKFKGHGQLYVAAYNMGPGNVKSALSRNKWPKDYAIHVMKRYLSYYEIIQKDTQNLIKRNIEILSSLHIDQDL